MIPPLEKLRARVLSSIIRPWLNLSRRRPILAIFEVCLRCNSACEYCSLPLPRGYFRRYVRDWIRWLNGESLEPCDAGRYSIAIDASGNVAPCLALKAAGNLLQDSLEEILDRLDGVAIRTCSDHSSCNMLCSRVVGSVMRRPAMALLTPTSLKPVAS